MGQLHRATVNGGVRGSIAAFTLGETAAAIALISFFLLPMLAMWVAGMDHFEKARSRAAAYMVAEALSSELSLRLPGERLALRKSAFVGDDAKELEDEYIFVDLADLRNKPLEIMLFCGNDGRPYDELSSSDYRNGRTPISAPLDDAFGVRSFEVISWVVKIELRVMDESRPSLLLSEYNDLQNGLARANAVLGDMGSVIGERFGVSISVEYPCAANEEERSKHVFSYYLDGKFIKR